MYEPKVELFYLEGSNPKDYDLVITIDVEETEGLKMAANRFIPNTPYNAETYQITVDMGTADTHKEVLRIHLGEFPLDPNDGELEVNLVNDTSKIVGKGKVRAEEAQQESRPIDEKF
jgi:hypothetical protein